MHQPSGVGNVAAVASEPDEAKRPSSLNGLDRVVAVLDALRATPGATLAAVARATGLSEPTTHRYLAAMREHRLVSRDPETGAYQLGMKLFELGHSALDAQDPRSVARPYLESLRDQFGETSVLAVRQDARLVLIAAVEGSHGVAKGARVGEQDYWHSTALGKSILAELDPDEARAILADTELTRFTNRTLIDPDDVIAALTRVRTEGVAMDDEESEIGLRCVGAVVRDAHGTHRYAISVSGPAYRITLGVVSDIAKSVREAAHGISRELGYAEASTDSGS